MSSSTANPLRTFHVGIAAYIALLSLTAVSNSGLVKLLANGAAVGLFLVGWVNWLFYPSEKKLSSLEILGLVVLYIGLFASVAVNFRHGEWVDVLKIALAPLYFVMGAALSQEDHKWSADHQGARLGLILLVVLPLLAFAGQLMLGLTTFGSTMQVGIFTNRNNAGLYVLSLLAFYAALTGRAVSQPLIYFFVAVVFGTLGLLVAVILAVLLCFGRVRYLLAGLLAVAAAVVVIHQFPPVSTALRIGPVVESVLLLLNGRVNLETVSFGDMVLLLGTSDLSFIFRLKHWLDLLNMYVSGSWSELAFGFGSGSSVRLSYMHLVPHNDFIRMLFEFGAIAFVGFSITLLGVIKSIGRGWSLVPFLALCIYFGSENLINNYAAMVLFFFSAGVVAQRRRVAEMGVPNGV